MRSLPVIQIRQAAQRLSAYLQQKSKAALRGIIRSSDDLKQTGIK